MKPIADAMGVARSNLVERAKPRQRKKRPPPADDAWLLPRIRALTDGRPSYGYRRTTALLNRELVVLACSSALDEWIRPPLPRPL